MTLKEEIIAAINSGVLAWSFIEDNLSDYEDDNETKEQAIARMTITVQSKAMIAMLKKLRAQIKKRKRL